MACLDGDEPKGDRCQEKQQAGNARAKEEEARKADKRDRRLRADVQEGEGQDYPRIGGTTLWEYLEGNFLDGPRYIIMGTELQRNNEDVSYFNRVVSRKPHNRFRVL